MDANLLLRDGSTNLISDETLSTTKIGPMACPMFLHVLVPSAGSGAMMDVEAEFCDEGEPTTQISNMNMNEISAAGHYCEPFFTLHDYIQVKLGVTGGATATVSMGAVEVWIDNTVNYDRPHASEEQVSLE
jgi:hypothetical protein